MTLKKILVFGNPLVRRDSIPLKLIDNLRNEFPKIEFKEFDSIEEIQNEGDTLYILDSVEKIKKVMVITDLDQLATDKIYSVHDFDLAYQPQDPKENRCDKKDNYSWRAHEYYA